MPVVVVSRWEEVTPSLLEKEWEKYAKRAQHGVPYQWRKLTITCYIELIRQAQAGDLKSGRPECGCS